MVRKELDTPWFRADPQKFENLRKTLREKYPTLHALEGNGRIAVSGTYRLIHDDAEIDRYRIEVVLPDDYPRSIPKIYETGGRIPRLTDRHVNERDGTLCVGIPEALWMRYQNKFDIETFLDGPVRSFFIGNGLVECGKPWPYGAWDHGAKGLWQFYMQTLGTANKLDIVQFLFRLVQSTPKGHWPCPCGSGEIIRRCHREAIRSLMDYVPTETIEASARLLLADAAKAAGTETTASRELGECSE